MKIKLSQEMFESWIYKIMSAITFTYKSLCRMHVPRQNIEFTPRDKTRDGVFATRVLYQSMENRGVYYTIEYGTYN
jgi:hypothetical protein